MGWRCCKCYRGVAHGPFNWCACGHARCGLCQARPWRAPLTAEAKTEEPKRQRHRDESRSAEQDGQGSNEEPKTVVLLAQSGKGTGNAEEGQEA